MPPNPEISASGPPPSLRPYRMGQVFSGANAFTWMIALGAPLTLLAEKLGATTFQVGVLYAFVLVLTPVQVVSTALLPRFGYKKIATSMFALRSLFLLVPLGLAVYAPEHPQAWAIHALTASIFMFSLLRSVGVCAIMPWIVTWIPENIRGRYFGTDQMIMGAAGILTLVFSAAVFKLLPEYTAFACLYTLAIAGSAAAVFALSRWPNFPTPESARLHRIIARAPGLLLRAGRFRSYLIVVVIWWAAISGFMAYLTYYLKREAGLTLSRIMFFTAFQYAGTVTGSHFARLWLDRWGVRPFFLVGVGIHCLVVGYTLLVVVFGGVWASFAGTAFFLAGLSFSSFFTAHFKYIPQLIDEEDRPLALNLQGATSGLIAGLTTIGIGALLKNASGAVDQGRYLVYLCATAGVAVFLVPFLSRLKETHPERPMLPLPPILLRLYRFVTLQPASPPRDKDE